MSRARAIALREQEGRLFGEAASDPAPAPAPTRVLIQVQAPTPHAPRSGSKVLKILFLAAGVGAAFWILSSDRPRASEQPLLPPVPDPTSGSATESAAATTAEAGDDQEAT